MNTSSYDLFIDQKKPWPCLIRICITCLNCHMTTIYVTDFLNKNKLNIIVLLTLPKIEYKCYFIPDFSICQFLILGINNSLIMYVNIYIYILDQSVYTIGLVYVCMY